MRIARDLTHETMRRQFLALPGDYAGLCRGWLPRKLHDTGEARETERIVRLMALYESDFTPDQRDYFDLLCDLLADFHGEQPEPWPSLPPAEMLRFIAGERGLSGADLSRLLGTDRSLGDKLLRGDRQLTLRHVRTLAAKLGVPAASFLGT